MPDHLLRRFALVCALLSLWGLAAGESLLAQAGGTAQLNAWQLLATARAAAVQLGRSLPTAPGGAGGLRPALATMQSQLASIEARFRSRDPQVFAELEGASRTLGELRLRWARAGIADPAAGASLRTLSVSYRRLRTAYGREGLRYRQGPPLTTEEEHQLERLRQGNLIFIARLQTLRQRAVTQGDRQRVAAIDRFLEASEQAAGAEPDLASYLNTTMASDELAGEWSATADDLRKLDSKGWEDADQAVEQLYVDSDVGQVFQLDLGTTQDWEYLDQPTQVDLGDAGGDGSDRPKMTVLHPTAAGPDGMIRFEAESGRPDSPAGEAADGAEAGASEAKDPSPAAPSEPSAPTPSAGASELARAWEAFRAWLGLWIGPLG